MRRNIYDILKSNKIDIKREYSRLFELYYYRTFDAGFEEHTIDSTIQENFTSLYRKLIGRCISLEDFNHTYDYNFVEYPNDFDIDYFTNFCEYTYNFSNAILGKIQYGTQYIHGYLYNVKECMEELGYILFQNEGIYCFAIKSAEAIAVAEIVPDNISYKVLEYNHHKLNGDVVMKKLILFEFAREIEPKRKELINVNKNLSDTLFQLLNKFIRHNNDENEFIANMTIKELEEIYDDIYQLWLLAMLEIDNIERKQKMKELLTKVNG